MTVSVATLLDAAPYLADLAARHADWFAAARLAPDVAFDAVLAELARAGADGSGEESVARALRLAKGRIALLAAVAEVEGRWTTERSTAALSDLADAALDAGLEVLIRAAVARGQLGPATAATSGLAIFALGKHGGRELNYSSDIDIVAFFDPDRAPLIDRGEATRLFSRIVQKLAGLMQDRTADGYVFRTDLRLRPDPGATPVALPVEAALAYYESRGQNWERAARIKARPCAGDRMAGEAFLKELAPYVWRKHLDFATIADIQAMKRQINITKNVGDVRVEGHNVKLGLGGIREIEFFTQTQQLIAGGRDPALRVRPTSAALRALAAASWISQKAADELIATYWYLRGVENRLQMRRDEQTHVMPETEAEIAIIGGLMGQPDRAAFESTYRAALNLVVGYYAELFAEGETLGSGSGNLVFTGSDDDPGTLETLSGMGFRAPSGAIATVRKWHYGGYAATRAAAARAHLTELLPALLRTLSEAGNPDEALARFDNFLSRLPSGVQLFALLRNHDNLRSLLVALMASAPRMAEAVIHRAHVMDGLIDPAFADEVRRRSTLLSKIADFFAEARDYQDVIDRARIIGQEQMFLIAAGLLAGTIDAQRAGEQFTTLAEALLTRLFAAVRTAGANAELEAQLLTAAELYNVGVNQLDSGDAAGQSTVEAASNQFAQICAALGFPDVAACLAQYGIELPPLPAAPAQPTQPTETPVDELPGADEAVTPEATEVLPETVAPEEAAPVLDSAKDATEESPAEPVVEEPAAPPPADDAAAQADIAPTEPVAPLAEVKGEAVESFDLPDFVVPQDVTIINNVTNITNNTTIDNGDDGKPAKPNYTNSGFIFQIGVNLVISNPAQDFDRISDDDEDEVYYERLGNGRVKETIVRPNGVQIVTICNRYGEVLKRSRIMPDGREYILAWYEEDEDEDDFFDWRDPGLDLPPLRLTIPIRDYVLDADDADEDEVELFFREPPVEKVRQIYSIDDVKRSARIRDSVRRIEVGGLTFDSGAATISRSQVGALSKVANAMLKMLDDNPAETFLIEGHTDAVGSDRANLVLSDACAATVVCILTDFYGVPPENLVTQGYGERYLKVKTEAAERLNRRVSIKRITPLITLAGQD